MEHKFLIYSKSEMMLVNEMDIVFIKAEGSYSIIFLSNGESFKQSDNMKQLFSKVTNKEFFQKAHRSYIVNIQMIKSFFKDESRGMKWSVKLKNGMSLPTNSEFLRGFKNEVKNKTDDIFLASQFGGFANLKYYLTNQKIYVLIFK